MNLAHLFAKQRELDERIVREKGLEGQDLLPMKILALQVELGELANEYRAWKFWSKDREPRRFKQQMKGFPINDIVESDPLLEEYVDCLHFILSIGLEIGNTDHSDLVYVRQQLGPKEFHTRVLVNRFNELFHIAGNLSDERWDSGDRYKIFDSLIVYFLGLGGLLNLSWQEIKQAYMAKNAENHNRQDRGY